MSTRAIRALRAKAASEFLNTGIVATDTAMALAAEGYDLTALDADAERLASSAARRMAG